MCVCVYVCVYEPLQQVTTIVYHYIVVLRFPSPPSIRSERHKTRGPCFLSASVRLVSVKRLCTESVRVHPIQKSGVAKENKHGSLFQRDNSKERPSFQEAEAHRYLGETGGLEKTPELRGDWRLKEREGEGEVEVGDTLRGLLRSPLCSFHISSSFSMDRRLLTLDSLWRDSCSTACSVDSCLRRTHTQRTR